MGKRKTQTTEANDTTSEAQPVTFSTRFLESLNAREAEVHSRDTELSISAVKGAAKQLDRFMQTGPFAEIADDLVSKSRIATVREAGKLNYIAVKVLVKIARTLAAIATESASQLDGYTRCIGANLCKLNGVTNKSALVCLSNSVEYDALDQTQDVVRKINCEPSTASTQASSTRMCLHYLGIADVVKGKRDDVTTLRTDERGQAFVSLYGEKLIAEETEE